VEIMKKQFSVLYSDRTRIIFDQLKGKSYSTNNFTYRQLSFFLRRDLKIKQSLTPIEMIVYGFLCPDHEF